MQQFEKEMFAKAKGFFDEMRGEIEAEAENAFNEDVKEWNEVVRKTGEHPAFVDAGLGYLEDE